MGVGVDGCRYLAHQPQARSKKGAANENAQTYGIGACAPDWPILVLSGDFMDVTVLGMGKFAPEWSILVHDYGFRSRPHAAMPAHRRSRICIAVEAGLVEGVWLGLFFFLFSVFFLFRF